MIGGGRVSFSIGGSVTGSTPQKSSVKRAVKKREDFVKVSNKKALEAFEKAQISTHMVPVT